MQLSRPVIAVALLLIFSVGTGAYLLTQNAPQPLTSPSPPASPPAAPPPPPPVVTPPVLPEPPPPPPPEEPLPTAQTPPQPPSPPTAQTPPAPPPPSPVVAGNPCGPGGVLCAPECTERCPREGALRWFPSGLSGLRGTAWFGGPHGAPVLVAIPGTASALWPVDHAAAVAQGYGGAPWSFSFLSPASFLGGFRFEIGTWDGHDFTPAVGIDLDGACFAPRCEGTVAPGPFTVPANQFLAFRATRTGEVGVPALTGSSWDTWVQAPGNDAPAPVPELGSLLLAAAGLALVGVAARRRA